MRYWRWIYKQIHFWKSRKVLASVTISRIFHAANKNENETTQIKIRYAYLNCVESNENPL